MALLPPALRDRLSRAPRLVVAPVGVGYREGLVAWARETGREVVADPASLDDSPALLAAPRRSLLGAVPHRLPLSETLVLAEEDVAFDATSWRDALSRSTEEFAARTFEQCDGWPLGLELAGRLGSAALPLHEHPLATVALERLLPEGDLREILRRAAATPLLLPELHGLLRIEPADARELHDLGFLVPTPRGPAMPRLLRRYLQPVQEPGTILEVAAAIARRGHLDAALDTLAEADQWGAYLERLAQGFAPYSQDAESYLRRRLLPVPAALRDTAAYRYLLGSLERLRGELERAQAHYRAARRQASGPLRARIDNARGIAFALAGDLDGAGRAFGSAARGKGGARLEGEARHNRAGVAIQQARFDEADRDLWEAMARFREAGDYVREARSMQLLALSRHQRGLLQEACSGYEEALGLLTTLGQPTALLRANLAEVLLLLGRAEEAKEQLGRAATEARGDARAGGYVEANQALWELQQGQADTARRRLEALARREGLDAHLRAEVELLLARALRTLGDAEEARGHARLAAPLGVAAALELAICEGGDLGPVIEEARRREARLELTTALLHRAGPGDLEEALALIRSHDFRILLDSPEHAAPLAGLAQKDSAMLELFPMRLTTFGTFAVWFLGRRLTLADFPTRKSAALLVRLAIAERPVAREVLASEFWDDASNPAHSLQTALYHLNRTLGVQAVGGRKGSAELVFPVRFDLAEFEAAATHVLDDAWDQGPPAVRSALALTQGEPLGEFPEWFEEDRRRAEALALRLWQRLAHLEAGDMRRSAEALESLLRLDPYDIEARSRLIEIYDSLGEPELARRQTELLRLTETEL